MMSLHSQRMQMEPVYLQWPQPMTCTTWGRLVDLRTRKTECSLPLLLLAGRAPQWQYYFQAPNPPRMAGDASSEPRPGRPFRA